MSDPANPRGLATVDTSGSAISVCVSGNYAYVADYGAGLQVIDISNPLNPQQVGGYQTVGVVRRVTVSGNYAYVPDAVAGLHILDISDPRNPKRIGGYSGGYYRGVALSGTLAYVAGDFSGLSVIDVSDAANPQRIGGNTAFPVNDVTVSGSHIFVSTARIQGESGSLIILDMFRPPRLEISLPHSQGAFGFQVLGAAGFRVRIQRSTNLTDWQDWHTVSLGAVPEKFLDVESSSTGNRFYRTVPP